MSFVFCFMKFDNSTLEITPIYVYMFTKKKPNQYSNLLKNKLSSFS